jgi:hypothetical protein
MRRVILMALSFGLVTTINAQTTNQNSTQEGQSGTETKTKTEVKKDQGTKAGGKTYQKTETKKKSVTKSEAGKTGTKAKTKTERTSADSMDQSGRSDVKFKSSSEMKGWNRASDNTWLGIDNYHYRLGTNDQLEKSLDGQNWRLSQSGRWQDDQGTYFRFKDKKLESSTDGNSWSLTGHNSWKGRDNVWYKYSDTDNSIYSTQTGVSTQDSTRINGGVNDNRKDVSPSRRNDMNPGRLDSNEINNRDINDNRKDMAPSRGMDMKAPGKLDSNDLDNRDVMPNEMNKNNVDTANFNDQAPRMNRRDVDDNREIFNMNDRSLQHRNMESQDRRQDEMRNDRRQTGGKLNHYNDRNSPK